MQALPDKSNRTAASSRILGQCTQRLQKRALKEAATVLAAIWKVGR